MRILVLAFVLTGCAFEVPAVRLQSVPAGVQSSEIDPLLPELSADLKRRAPGLEVLSVASRQPSWEMVRHPHSGLLLRRIAWAGVAFRAPQSGKCYFILPAIKQEAVMGAWAALKIYKFVDPTFLEVPERAHHPRPPLETEWITEFGRALVLPCEAAIAKR